MKRQINLIHKFLDWLVSNLGAFLFIAAFIVFFSFHIKPESQFIKYIYILLCKTIGLDEDDELSVNSIAGLAKVVFGASVLRIYLKQVGFKLDNFWARISFRETIIYGSGDEAITAALVLSKIYPVLLIVDRELDEESISRLRAVGVIVFYGKGSDIDNLKACNVSGAKTLLAFRDQYAQNIALCKSALKQIGVDSPLKCLCNVPDINLKHSLTTSDFFSERDLERIKFVNQIELTARNMIDEYPPDAAIATYDNVYAKIVLVGLGSIGQSVLFYLAQLGHYRGGHKPKVKVIDKNASRQYQRLIKRLPALNELLDIECIESDINDLTDETVDELFGKHYSPSVVYVCTKNEICNVVSAKKIFSACAKAELTGSYKIVLVDPPGGKLIQEFSQDNKNIEVVPLFSNKNTDINSGSNLDVADRLFEYANDQKAQAVHRDYRNHYPGTENDKDWEILEESIRDSNRFQVAHIEIKLRAIGRKVVPLDKSVSPFKFSDQELAVLSRMEHARWCADKKLNGWKYSATRDGARKLHHNLVDFDELSEADKMKDHQSIENIPNLLKTFNLMIA
jgi:lactate dehydrogenase-like 2-hydroxyacid dehydrogenase